MHVCRVPSDPVSKRNQRLKPLWMELVFLRRFGEKSIWSESNMCFCQTSRVIIQTIWLQYIIFTLAEFVLHLELCFAGILSSITTTESLIRDFSKCFCDHMTFPKSIRYIKTAQKKQSSVFLSWFAEIKACLLKNASCDQSKNEICQWDNKHKLYSRRNVHFSYSTGRDFVLFYA